jgi:hypothetical protein
VAATGTRLGLRWRGDAIRVRLARPRSTAGSSPQPVGRPARREPSAPRATAFLARLPYGLAANSSSTLAVLAQPAGRRHSARLAARGLGRPWAVARVKCVPITTN